MRMLSALFAIALSLLVPASANAHAMLRRASPPVGSTVQMPPQEIVLEFTEAIEPRFSTIVVRDAQGQRVDKNDPHAAPNDPKNLIVSLTGIKRGDYKVEWRAISVDTHKTQGSFTFSVAH
jgi:copper resistance protein C